MNSELVGEDVNEVEADAIFDVLEYKDELEAKGKESEVIDLIDASLNELADQEEATEAAYPLDHAYRAQLFALGNAVSECRVLRT